MPVTPAMHRHVLAEAITRLWGALRADHPDLPPVSVDLRSTRGTQCGYAPVSSGPHTLRVPREVLAGGAEEVLRHVIHVAAHALSAARGKTDTSNRGRYHTDVFAASAREVGMLVPERADRCGTGFAAASLPSGTVPASPAWLAGELAGVRAALPEGLTALPPRAGGRAGGRIAMVCACRDAGAVYVSQGRASSRSLACTVCGEVLREKA